MGISGGSEVVKPYINGLLRKLEPEPVHVGGYTERDVRKFKERWLK